MGARLAILAALCASACTAPAASERPSAAMMDMVFCSGHPEECTAYDSTHVASNFRRRSPNDRDQEVRTLGFTVRWDPGTGGPSDIVAGNTPTYNGDLRSDP